MARPDNPANVYLDANSLIIGAMKRPGYEPVEDLLRLAEAGRVTLSTSTFSYVEVRGQANNDPYDEELDRKLIALLDSRRIEKVEFGRAVGILARRVAREHHLKNFDAVHLASAIMAEADVLMTWDKGFNKNRGHRVDGVWLDVPYFLGPDRLI